VDTDAPDATPSLGAFNHMVVAVPGSTRDSWDYVDCTNKRLAYTPGQIPWLLGGRKALLVGRDTRQSTRLRTIPTASSPEIVQVNRRATPLEGGRLSVTDEISCEGLAACELRWRLSTTGESAAPASLARLFGLDRSLFPIREASVENADSPDRPLTLRLTYEARKGLQKQGDALVAHLPFNVESRLLDPQELFPGRNSGAYFEFPTRVITLTRLDMPNGMRLAAEPPIAEQTPYLRHQFTRDTHADHALLRGEVTRLATTLPDRKSYEEFQANLLTLWGGLDTLPLARSPTEAGAALAGRDGKPEPVTR
jgi:hypothetical protein